MFFVVYYRMLSCLALFFLHFFMDLANFGLTKNYLVWGCLRGNCQINKSTFLLFHDIKYPFDGVLHEIIFLKMFRLSTSFLVESENFVILFCIFLILIIFKINILNCWKMFLVSKWIWFFDLRIPNPVYWRYTS